MSARPFSTEHLDYLQRAGMQLHAPPPDVPWTSSSPALRRLARIGGIGRIEKDLSVSPDSGSMRAATEDLIEGSYGYRIPLAFLVTGTPDGVSLHLGTWSSSERERASAQTLDARQDIIEHVIGSLYASVDLTTALPRDVPTDLRMTGLGVGIPTLKASDLRDPMAPIDRLSRAMEGSSWAYLVLAEPVDESLTVSLRRSVINEMRAVETNAQSQLAPSPLSQHYENLLDALGSALIVGHAIGMWRTAASLFGDASSYYRLATAWRAIHSGEASLPEPLRVWDVSGWGDSASLFGRWAMPDTPAPQGPGLYHHPFEHQTLLTSQQLTSYIHLPEVETAGFSIDAVPAFDAVAHPVVEANPVRLGTIVHRARPTNSTYEVSLDSLAKHSFVAGVTGSGKTNTIVSLLRSAHRAGASFLVLEPAKTEYRALLNDPEIGADLRVYTLGDENVSPFRLNPFEVPDGTAVGKHLDLLRSVFIASFGMWSPLPQILEECMHRIYRDRGWDTASDTNLRLGPGDDRSRAFPTLSDLVDKIEDVTREAGYGTSQVTADIRAALHTRVNSLRTGGKGRMLDVQRSIPMSELLERPTVLELEGMGDEDDRAFLMGLLFIRLVEHRRSEMDHRLHLLVIEEAHRLLTNTLGRVSQDQADARGKAVESFANLLAEIRAYRQGVVVADQVPVKLAPDVVKNTELKIAHRIVDAEDREVLAAAMSMNGLQADSLSNFRVGQAAVFSGSDDAPVLLSMERVTGDEIIRPVSDEGVRERMGSIQERTSELFQRHEGCADPPPGPGLACDLAKSLVERREMRAAVARIATSLVEDSGALDRLWPDVEAQLAQAARPGIDRARLHACSAGRAADDFADRLGARAGWTYGDTGQLADALRSLLQAKVAGSETRPATEMYRKVAAELQRRTWDPFPGCAAICAQVEPLCLYRHAAHDLTFDDYLAANWRRSLDADVTEGPARPRSWSVAKFAGMRLVGRDAPEEVVRRAALCFGQMKVYGEPDLLPEMRDRDLDALRDAARSGSS